MADVAIYTPGFVTAIDARVVPPQRRLEIVATSNQ
jgi:hypothetical protein